MAIRSGGVTRHVARLVIMLALGTSLAGCASHGTPAARTADATTITEVEIDSAHVATAYDVIHKLRPQFLISRGKLSLDPAMLPALPRVYMDDQFYGDVSTLRGILAGTIESIHYYSAGDAQYKYGHDNAAGVIAIVTKH